MGGWDELEAIGRVQQSEREVEADLQERPRYCPVCLSRLNWRGTSADCPYGHFRHEG